MNKKRKKLLSMTIIYTRLISIINKRGKDNK